MKPSSIRPFDRLVLVGAGFMGAQISLECAVHGYAVTLVDSAPEAFARATQLQREELDRRVAAGLLSPAAQAPILERIRFTTDLDAAVAAAEWIIEAVPERLDLKRTLFARLDALCPAETVLATNSSSLRITAIEDAVSEARRSRVLNLHFFAPIWHRPMVELMGGTMTSPETLARAAQFVRSIGYVPLWVRKESTGFIFNRVWRAIKKECLHLVDAGVATHEDVDRAWMLFNKTPYGPFGMMDLIGLDVVHDIELVYYRESGDPSDAPAKLLVDKLARGELGIKTGRGFYTYPHPAYEAPEWLKGEGE